MSSALLGVTPPGRQLGRRKRTYHQNIPHFSSMRLKYRGMELKPLPESVHWAEGMPASLGLLLNDHLGDCTIAGIYHARQVWSYAANKAMELANNSLALKMYTAICGYVDGQPDTDNGGIEQHVLGYWVNTGIPTNDNTLDKLLGFVELDPRAQQDAKRAIAEGGVVYIGIDIPEAWTQSAPGSVWDKTDSPVAGGHCVICVGYDDMYVDIISWGLHFKMTWGAWSEVVDEAYMLLDRAWIRASGLSPFDMTEPDLEAALVTLKRAA